MRAAGAVALTTVSGSLANAAPAKLDERRHHRARKMFAVQAPTKSRRNGPFVLPARVVLVFSGGLAIAMGLVHLFDEVQRTEVDLFYAVVAVIVSQLWLFSLFFAWRGNRLALAVAGFLAFAEFGIQASTHFAIGVYAVEFLAPSRGIGFTVNLLLLEVACAICFISAIICASNPRGTARRLESFPFLLVALAGASAVILHAANDVGLKSFGSISIEDGLAFAAITATAWIIGALWMAGAPRLGALLVALATANVVIPFVTLHLAKGGVSLNEIAKQSGGAGWAVLAGAMAILAAASLMASLTWLAWRVIPARRQSGSRLPS